MSGIVGVLYLDGKPVIPDIIEGMLARIAHRGPDGRGIWCNGSVGLGQCMLWTTTESVHERQPILTSQADMVLVADARLDNRGALIKSLAQASIFSNQVSDGQLILEAYREWGYDCLSKIEGDYTFVIWDDQLQTLICVRDRVGVKPFYYVRTPVLFAFASEIKALLALAEIPQALNERKIVEYLSQDFEDTVETFYKEIYRLPPGHWMKINDAKCSISRYWGLDVQEGINFKNESGYLGVFKELFSEAVRCRLRSVYPVGSMLSGGLDSSSVACTAHNLIHSSKDNPLPVFSVIHQDQADTERARFDELKYIKCVLDSGYFEPHYIRGDQISPLIDSDQLYSELDEPYFAPTYYLYRGLHQSAQQRGVRVLLDGTDGDRTVYHGLEHLSDLARSGRWSRLYRESYGLSKGQFSHLTPKRILWNYGIKPILPDLIFHLKRWLQKDRQSVVYHQHLIRPEFIKRLGLRYSDFVSYSGTNKSLRQAHYHELTSGVIPLALELLDKSCAKHRIDARYPFFDRRLMEYCLSLPPQLKISRGWTRYILRVAMQDIIPEPIQWRADKANLEAAFCVHFYHKEINQLHKKVDIASSTLEEYINTDLFRNIYDSYTDQPSQHPIEVRIIFGVIILSDWLRRVGWG